MTPDTASAERFSMRVRTLTGIADATTRERVIQAVISVLVEQLPPAGRALLARVLPSRLAAAIGSAPYRGADGVDAFYERVGRREGIEQGFAIEHAQSVCRALADVLDDGANRQLATYLADDVAQLLTVPEPDGAPAVARGRAHSLATGRPGSSHPLSEGRPERAQRESIARSENPHADTKLSSTAGMTQEREGEDLASSKGGDRR